MLIKTVKRGEPLLFRVDKEFKEFAFYSSAQIVPERCIAFHKRRFFNALFHSGHIGNLKPDKRRLKLVIGCDGEYAIDRGNVRIAKLCIYLLALRA